MIPLTRQHMAMRAAQDLQSGQYVNLGIGIPTLVANYLAPGVEIIMQSENGLLGLGPFPAPYEVDADLINAGKQTVTALPGAAFFSSAESFAMIRGGHMDVTILGAFEVDISGSLASWMIPGQMVKGMGGAMDLVSGAQRVVVVMNHCNKQGISKLLKRCTLPLTGVHCVHRVITDLAVLDIRNEAFYLIERAPGVSMEMIQEHTAAPLRIEGEVPEMCFV